MIGGLEDVGEPSVYRRSRGSVVVEGIGFVATVVYRLREYLPAKPFHCSVPVNQNPSFSVFVSRQ